MVVLSKPLVVFKPSNFSISVCNSSNLSEVIGPPKIFPKISAVAKPVLVVKSGTAPFENLPSLL